jgi:iron complex transport system substrate-binding protein
LPSATEIVCALGLEERLVGISHSCDYPPTITHLPRLTRPRRNLDGLPSAEIDAAVRAALHEDGGVYEIDLEAIRVLAPDLVLTQGICDVCAVPESQVIASLVPTLTSGPSEVLRLDAHDLAAIFGSIREVGCAAGVMERAEGLIDHMQQRIAAVRERVAARPRPRVLALEWLDPPYVPGHWVPELIAAAGGDLVAGMTRRPSYRMEWSELRALRPDVLLIMPCGFDLAATRREAKRYEAVLRGIAPRTHLCDAAAYFSRSGPRVADGVELLASAIFPM